MQKSFIPVEANSHFPIQNLPYGIFSLKTDVDSNKHIGVAIGDYVLDLTVLEQEGLLQSNGSFATDSLNHFMAQSPEHWREIRQSLQSLLDENTATLRDDDALRSRCLIAMADVQMHLPVTIGDYTDFYSSIEHATNVGIMFRGKENALMPNWKELPVAYHGRASSVVVSETAIRRPLGQVKADDKDRPDFAASRLMDFELEMGYFVGQGTDLGDAIDMKDAHRHLFGMVVVNDWSARDIQKWEYQPLGPFLAKNLGTSISPWIVTFDALEPFRMASPTQDPEPLAHLQRSRDAAYDIQLQVDLQSEQMAKETGEKLTICKSNFKYMYWDMAQQLTHHSSSGCNLRTGDLLASGTLSGPTEDSYGSLLELTWRGTKPIQLPTGEERRFLQDGDTVTMSAWAQGEGYRVGFGEVKGTITPHR